MLGTLNERARARDTPSELMAYCQAVSLASVQLHDAINAGDSDAAAQAKALLAVAWRAIANYDMKLRAAAAWQCDDLAHEIETLIKDDVPPPTS